MLQFLSCNIFHKKTPNHTTHSHLGQLVWEFNSWVVTDYSFTIWRQSYFNFAVKKNWEISFWTILHHQTAEEGIAS